MLEALFLTLGSPLEVCPAGNLADVVVTDSSGQQAALGPEFTGLDLTLGPLAPGSSQDYRLSLVNTSELNTYELVVTLEGVEVPQVLVTGAHPLLVQAGLSTGEIRQFAGPTQGVAVAQSLGSLGPGQRADLVLDFALGASPVLSRDGMGEQAVFEVGLGATVDCRQGVEGQDEVEPGGDMPGGSQPDGGQVSDRPVDGSQAALDSQASPGPQSLARTGLSSLALVGLGAGLVLVGLACRAGWWRSSAS